MLDIRFQTTFYQSQIYTLTRLVLWFPKGIIYSRLLSVWKTLSRSFSFYRQFLVSEMNQSKSMNLPLDISHPIQNYVPLISNLPTYLLRSVIVLYDFHANYSSLFVKVFLHPRHPFSFYFNILFFVSKIHQSKYVNCHELIHRSLTLLTQFQTTFY